MPSNRPIPILKSLAGLLKKIKTTIATKTASSASGSIIASGESEISDKSLIKGGRYVREKRRQKPSARDDHALCGNDGAGLQLRRHAPHRWRNGADTRSVLCRHVGQCPVWPWYHGGGNGSVVSLPRLWKAHLLKSVSFRRNSEGFFILKNLIGE